MPVRQSFNPAVRRNGLRDHPGTFKIQCDNAGAGSANIYTEKKHECDDR
jgi:hypothetical protein